MFTGLYSALQKATTIESSKYFNNDNIREV